MNRVVLVLLLILTLGGAAAAVGFVGSAGADHGHHLQEGVRGGDPCC